MKKSTLLLLVLFGSFTSFAQDKENDSLERNSNWIIEAHVGNIKGVKPYSEGYFSSKPNSFFGQWEPNSFSLGARYLIGEIFSVKLVRDTIVLEIITPKVKALVLMLDHLICDK